MYKHTISLKKVMPYIMTLLLIIILLSSLLYYYNHSIISDGLLVAENISELVYQIDEAYVENNDLIIRGWCFLKDESISNTDNIPTMRIILADVNNYDNRKGFIATYGINRPEVGNYFNTNELTYNLCGFQVNIDINDIDIENTNYEIVIQQNIRKPEAVRTGTFIGKEGMRFCNPSLFYQLEVKDTDLETIVEKGILRSFRPDIGMYIYQYYGNIYWIADSYYKFDEWPFICYMLETTQKEKLPEERKSINVDFDNLGCTFDSIEITDNIKCGKYRVAVMKIPDSYSVTVITTGVYNNNNENWVWRERFLPRYCFE